MTYRSSFSQHNKFDHHPRYWFYEKILKIPYTSDLCYAHAGNVIHGVLEEWYGGKFGDIQQAKKYFYEQWNKYQLDGSKIFHMKDDYWLMCIEGINKKLPLTDTELKLSWDDYLGFIDCVDSVNCELYDWKSSKRREENEAEYTKQLKLYSWVYYRKFGVIPKKCKVFYLRYPGSKGELEFVPTMDTIKETEKWYYDILKQMVEYKETKKLPPKCSNCNPWCPYKIKCENDDKQTVYNLYLRGNYIYLDGPVSKMLHNGLDKKFSYELKDAYFIKRAKPHANTTIRFWDLKNKRLPIGFLNGIQKTLSDYIKIRKLNGQINVIDERRFDDKEVEMPDKFLNDRTLRDYQQDAVNCFLDKKIAMIESATGSGKTEIAIEIIRLLQCRTLFIVDKVELLNQTRKRIKDTLGIEVGIIGQGKMDIKDITVATIQTLNKRIGDFRDYLKTIKFVIFDECHKVAARSFWNLSHYLTGSLFRLGLSATPFRDDKNDMYINAVTGYSCIQLNAKKMINAGWLAKPNITFISDFMNADMVQRLDYKSQEGLINEEKKYSKYYDNFIVKNKVRNYIIHNLVKFEKNKKILILVKLVEHGNYLSELIGAPYLFGGTNKKERAEILEEFTNGKTDVLIGTISIFSEGIDIPKLYGVINAAANAGDIKTIQMLGRVMRLFEGKEPVYYDFEDYSDFFKAASYRRKHIFKRQGHDVKSITVKKILGDKMFDEEYEDMLKDNKVIDDDEENI